MSRGTYSNELSFFVLGHALERVVLASEVATKTTKSLNNDLLNLTSFSS